MHVHTVVKVRADSEADAVDRVNRLLTDNWEYHIDSFDWVAEDETKISATVKTEADFRNLREMDRDEHIENLRRSGEEADEYMKGFYLREGWGVPGNELLEQHRTARLHTRLGGRRERVRRYRPAQLAGNRPAGGCGHRRGRGVSPASAARPHCL